MRVNIENIAKSEDSSHLEVRRESYSMLSEMNECPGRQSLMLMH